jgi:hypothetical protein
VAAGRLSTAVVAILLPLTLLLARTPSGCATLPKRGVGRRTAARGHGGLRSGVYLVALVLLAVAA